MADPRRVFWNYLYVVLAIALAAPAAATATTDPLIAQQWALDGPAIGAPQAWTQSSGAGVLVAVLDTGLQLDHADIAANVWTNPREVPANGRDDDANGIVDDVHGANMIRHSAAVGDDHGHGTHVAGIIAARRGNGIGGSGLAPDAKILPVKVLDSSMAGTTDALAQGIRYAVDAGAKILNVSINSDAAASAVTSAVRYAGERGAIVVASAGNNRRNIDLLPSYPASLPDPAVLSVAASNGGGTLWDLSNSGPLSVDLAAPGQQIVSTTLASAYGSRSGTSAAAPFVAGALALLSAARPDLPAGALRTVLIDSARRSGPLASLLGSGGLDVGAAMRRALAGRPWTVATAGAATLRLRTASTTRAGGRSTLRWSATGAARVTRWRISLDGRVVKTVDGDRTSISRRVSRSGRHSWRVVGFDADHAKVVAARRAFRTLRAR